MYWRLVYADDSFVDEPDDNKSILEARPGAVVLHVTKNVETNVELAQGRPLIVRQPVMEVDLHGGWKPVFYRRRSMAATGGATRLEATIFGRGKPTLEGGCNSTVYMMKGTGTVNPPPHLVDGAMIKHQLGVE